MLDNIYRSPAETRSNMWTTVKTAVAPLLSEVAREAFSPPRGHEFDIEGFLRERGTAYLIVPEYQAGELAPIVSAFVEEITQAAARAELRQQHHAAIISPHDHLPSDGITNTNQTGRPPPNPPGLCRQQRHGHRRSQSIRHQGGHTPDLGISRRLAAGVCRAQARSRADQVTDHAVPA